MSGAEDDGTQVRDRDTIERELRLLASVRSAYRERGGALPSINQMDALLEVNKPQPSLPRLRFLNEAVGEMKDEVLSLEQF